MKFSEVVAEPHTGITNLSHAIDSGAYAVIKEREPIRRPGWIYCKISMCDLPQCKMDQCRFYPCVVNP